MNKVLILKSEAKQQGGLEKSALRIVDAFQAKGAQVTLISPAKKSFFFPWHRMEQFDRLAQKWVEEHKPDLVFGMDRNRFQTHLRAGNGVHQAYLKSRILAEGKWKYYSCLCNPMHRKILQLEKEAFEHPGLKKVIANSAMVKQEILQNYSIEESKIEVLHNGVEWQEMEGHFQTGKKNSAVFQLLFIGNGYLRKGLDKLLLALARLGRKDVHLSIVGKEKRMDNYRTLAAKLKITDQVTFFGPQSNTLPFYQLADALIIPSFYDPFANVTLEALAMGLFVVSSRSNGGSEILSEENGYIIEDLLSTDSMIQALETAIRHPKNRQSALMIRNSVQRFDFSHHMQKLMDICLG